MKLKPLGRKYAAYIVTFLVSSIGLFITFRLGWGVFLGVCMAAWFISVCRIMGISIDANFSKYGFWGFRGPDELFEYEPGDKDYEKEKFWQEKEEEDEEVNKSKG